jgi:hypothetical protein
LEDAVHTRQSNRRRPKDLAQEAVTGSSGKIANGQLAETICVQDLERGPVHNYPKEVLTC